MNTWTILLAAGSGSRMAAAGMATRKQFLEHNGAPLFWHAARAFSRVAGISGMLFVLPPDEHDAMAATISGLADAEPLGLSWMTTTGGHRRQDSVENGLAALPRECTHVLVHDSARCFVTPAVIARVLEAMRQGAKAVIPAIAVKDTIKEIENGVVVATPNRERLVAVQTPQGVDRSILLQGFAKAKAEGLDVTDDASLAEAVGATVVVVEGSEDNVKITTPQDLRLLAAQAPTMALPRVGFGYDVHRYVTAKSPEGTVGRPMVLGGAPIAGAPQVIAHSDGDVLLHALADALLGCLGQGDIGQHFPDTDAKYSGIESGVLVSEILAQFGPAGLTLCHVDLTIVAQVPKIGPHRDHIRRNVAGLLGLSPDVVNVKATTEEHLGFTGAKLGIKAYATATAIAATHATP